MGRESEPGFIGRRIRRRLRSVRRWPGLRGAAVHSADHSAAARPSIDQLDRSHLPDDQSYVPRELQARQLKRLREEHQKEVFSDAARLVQLATALKQQVQKGDKVSVDAIKDVDEIGKLAKRLSDRIKTQ